MNAVGLMGFCHRQSKCQGACCATVASAERWVLQLLGDTTLWKAGIESTLCPEPALICLWLRPSGDLIPTLFPLWLRLGWKIAEHRNLSSFCKCDLPSAKGQFLQLPRLADAWVGQWVAMLGLSVTTVAFPWRVE